MSGKKQPHPKMPKKYGRVLKKMSMSEEEKEELEKGMDEDIALSVFQ